ncbi:MAG: T9SS type A sorting domain-containing protein [Bacteroidota bacterium]
MKILFTFLLFVSIASAQTPEWSRKYHTGSVTCLDFSSDGGKLVSGGRDSTVRLWDISKGDTLKSYKQVLQVHSVQINSRSEWFVASMSNSNLSGYRHNVKQFLNQDTAIIKFGANGTFYSNSHGYKAIFFFSANQMYLLNDDKQVITILSGGITGVDGPTTYYGNTSIIETFSLDSISKQISIKVGGGDNTAISLSPDNRYFVYGGHDYQRYAGQTGYKPYEGITDIWLCEIYDFQNKKTFKIPGLNIDASKATPHNAILKTAFTADSKNLLTANLAGIIHVRSVPYGEAFDSLSTGPISKVTALAGDMPGNYYITTHEDSTLRIWTPGIPNIFKRISLQSPVTTIAVSPDSVHFATAHIDGTVALWNLDSLVLKAVTDSVFTPGIALQPESQMVCRNSDVFFKTQAIPSFGGNIFYKWRKDGIDVADNAMYLGAHTAELKIVNTQSAHVGKYTAIAFTSKGDSVLTNSANLSLIAPLPVITQQPDSIIRLKSNGYHVLMISLKDTAKYNFQWYFNGDSITGYQDRSFYPNSYLYKINNTNPVKDNGIYVLKYWNKCDTITSRPILVEVETVVSVAENSFKNIQFSITPNPFKNSATIHFSLPKPLKIKLAVTDMLGREVEVLKDGLADEGENTIVFKSDDLALAEGAYFLTLRSESGIIATQQIVINR